MAHVEANIVQFYTKLDEYQNTGKYADVTIECEEKIFKCHRVILAMASNFFDTMFSSRFRERTDSEIFLSATTAVTFKEVVQFIYTGDVSIKSSNVNSLLEASEFFGLPGISDLCARFIATHKISVQETLRAFIFACRTSKQVLIDRLSKDIAEHFRIFSRVDEFLEIPFEGLQIILRQLLSPESADVKTGAIGRWISHSREGRSQHTGDLAKMICFGNVTNEFIQSMFAKFWAEPENVGSVTESLKPISFNDILETPRKSELQKNLLHVYVRSTNKDDSMRVFSVNNGNHCTVTHAKKLLNPSPYQWIRNVSLDNHLFRLDYCRRHPNDAEPISEQAFSIHSSFNMTGRSLGLKPPPLIFGDVSFCALGNNIYAYHKTVFCPLVRTSSKNLTSFDDEEISRGVYIYNCELDNWFPVPAMKKKLQESCMVGWNDQILYLIDGMGADGYYVKCVQAYDCRVGTWQELSETNNIFTNFATGDGCVYNGKIYVCGGEYCEVFNPTACKWENSNLGRRMGSPMKYHRMISYSDKLWAIGSLSGGVDKDNLSSVRLCPMASQTWSSSDVLKRATIHPATDGVIVDVVIF